MSRTATSPRVDATRVPVVVRVEQPCAGRSREVVTSCAGVVEWPLFVGSEAKCLRVTLRFESSGTAGAGVMRLAGASAFFDGASLLSEGGGGSVVRDAAGLWHVHVPGVIVAALRGSLDGEAELLYARTPLVERVGACGGQVERPRWVVG